MSHICAFDAAPVVMVHRAQVGVELACVCTDIVPESFISGVFRIRDDSLEADVTSDTSHVLIGGTA